MRNPTHVEQQPQVRLGYNLAFLRHLGKTDCVYVFLSDVCETNGQMECYRAQKYSDSRRFLISMKDGL